MKQLSMVSFENFSTAIHSNLPEEPLYEEALKRGEAKKASSGALVAVTGSHTGRSAKDKFIVLDDVTRDSVWWDNNAQMSAEVI